MGLDRPQARWFEGTSLSCFDAPRQDRVCHVAGKEHLGFGSSHVKVGFRIGGGEWVVGGGWWVVGHHRARPRLQLEVSELLAERLELGLEKQ